jgi:hypothetical protein
VSDFVSYPDVVPLFGNFPGGMPINDYAYPFNSEDNTSSASRVIISSFLLAVVLAVLF